MTDAEIAKKLGVTEESVAWTRANFIRSKKLGPDGFNPDLPPEKEKLPEKPPKDEGNGETEEKDKEKLNEIEKEISAPVLAVLKSFQGQITAIGDGLTRLTETVNQANTAGAAEKAGVAPTPAPAPPTVKVENLPIQLPGNTMNMPISPTTQLLYAIVAARMQKKGVEMVDFATWIEIGMKDWCKRKGIQLGVYNLGYQQVDIGGSGPL